MSDDPGGRRVGREVDRVFPSPAETCCADLEVRGREGRRRGSKGLEEGEDAGFGERGAVSEEPGEDDARYLEDVEGFVEDGCEPAGGLFDLILH